MNRQLQLVLCISLALFHSGCCHCRQSRRNAAMNQRAAEVLLFASLPEVTVKETTDLQPLKITGPEIILATYQVRQAQENELKELKRAQAKRNKEAILEWNV